MGYFEHIGEPVSFGEVEISAAEAELFRRSAIQGTKIRTLYMDHDTTHIDTASYATGVLSDAAADYSVSEDAYFGKTTYGSSPDYWHSRIFFARYNAKNRNTKIYNMYEVESVEGEVVLARRRVRVIRNLSRIAFQDGDPIEEVYSRQHKGFERLMTSDDVAMVAERVDRTMRRQAATRK